MKMPEAKNYFPVVLMILFALCQAHSVVQAGRFPIKTCNTDNFDLVVVFDGENNNDIEQQAQLLSVLDDAFQGSASDPERIQMAGVILGSGGKAKTLFPLQKTGEISVTLLSNLEMEQDNNTVEVDLSSLVHQLLFPDKEEEEEEEENANSTLIRNRRNNTIPVCLVITKDVSGSEQTTLKNIAGLQNSRDDLYVFTIIISETNQQGATSQTARSILEDRTFFILTSVDSSDRQYLPYELCSVCPKGWISKEFDYGDILDANFTNCYNLNYKTENVEQIRLYQDGYCDRASAAAFETPEELPEVVEDYCSGQFPCFLFETTIGLKRVPDWLYVEYEWFNGMPLRYKPWSLTRIPGTTNNNLALDCAEIEVDFFSDELLVFGVDCSQVMQTVGSKACEYPQNTAKVVRPRLSMHMEASLASIQEAVGSVPLVRCDLADGQWFLLDVTHAQTTRDRCASIWLLLPGANGSVTSKPFRDIPSFHCSNPQDSKGERIGYAAVCNHFQDCSNGADEDSKICGASYPYAGYRQCTEDEYLCSNGQCIPKDGRCDLVEDCVDGSDETDCSECRQFSCNIFDCATESIRLDGISDCEDLAMGPVGGPVDETGTYFPHPTLTQRLNLWWIESCVLLCNHTVCINYDQLIDNVTDCHGPEGHLDKELGHLTPFNCSFTPEKGQCSEERIDDCFYYYPTYHSWAPRCIYQRDRNDIVIGCRIYTHLENCENFQCPEGYVKCQMSHFCIPWHYVRDGNPDCSLGEDEVDFLSVKTYGAFRCVDGLFIHPTLVCNNRQDCSKGEDEIGCHMSCQDGFRCLGGAVYLDETYDNSAARTWISLGLPFTNFDFVTPSTRYLDLSGLTLTQFFKDQRFGGHFRDLLHLSLSDCGIESFEKRPDILTAPTDFTLVQWIDLSHNLLTELGTSGHSLLRDMPHIMYLNLSHNTRLEIIENSIFLYMSELEVLDLSHTAISVIPNSLSTTLLKLEYFDASHTRVTRLLPNAFPSSIREIYLTDTDIEEFNEDLFKGLLNIVAIKSDASGLCCPLVRSSDVRDDQCEAPVNAFSSCTDLMKEPVLQVLLWVMGCIALLGNTVMLVYRVVDKELLKRSYGKFVTNMCFADLLMGVYLIIVAVADVKYRGIYIWNDYTWRHSAACSVAGFLSTLSSEVSVMFISLVTVDRFLVTQFPYGDFRISNKGALIACIVVWSLGLCMAILPFFPWDPAWTVSSTSSVCLGLPLDNNSRPGWLYSVTLFIFFNFVLFVFIAIGQLAIYRVLSKHEVPGGDAMTQLAARKRTQDIEIAQRLALVVISDFLCWFPIGVMGLYTLSGGNIGGEAYAWSAVVILPINSALNPVLYTLPTLVTKWREFKTKNLKTDKSQKQVSSSDGTTKNTTGAETMLHALQSIRELLPSVVFSKDKVLGLKRLLNQMLAKTETMMEPDGSSSTSGPDSSEKTVSTEEEGENIIAVNIISTKKKI